MKPSIHESICAVVRTGRTAAATVGFYLSIDGKRDRRDVHLAGDARIAAGEARVVRIVVRPHIATGPRLDAYHLIACVAPAAAAALARCRSLPHRSGPAS